MVYGHFKDLPRRIAADKVLRDEAFNYAKNPKYDGYQRELASGAKSWIMPNQELAEELRKPIIRKFEKRKVYRSFKDNTWGADLADMQLISKFKKGFHFLLCVSDAYSKYTWIVPLKYKI